MKDYLVKDEWKVIEDGFHPEYNQISESIFSIGNGYMGQRANFPELFSGQMLRGSYISGIYYPDKTRVGWWKNGYPEYFAKVLNSVNWIGVKLIIDEVEVDLNTVRVYDFRRCLDMQRSVLSRECKIELASGQSIHIATERFCSYETQEIGCLRYILTSIDFEGEVKLVPYLDFNVKNQDANYDEVFWEIDKESYLLKVVAETKKTRFRVVAQMSNVITRPKEEFNDLVESTTGYTQESFTFNLSSGEEARLDKLVAIHTSFHHKGDLEEVNDEALATATKLGYDTLLSRHTEIWKQKWAQNDIIIDGDVAAQQGIRFNILHMHQTYSGVDHRLNIGPKGFTGEKYGGSTYWDTEAYCLPFYMSTADQDVARNLLMYRYNQLDKAIENAEKLGFTNGAALYPMVTMNGEECHNEWEITFEEIHRNGAIAYAIYDYTRYTGDTSYARQYGIEVLIGICRFWSQRFTYAKRLGKYVMLGVTGPNEYENNVNNNWYTNYIATWCFKYCQEVLSELKNHDAQMYHQLITKTAFNEEKEVKRWNAIKANVHLPYHEELGVFLQQDGFLDKELMPASDLPDEVQPLHQHWSWDRILRSCFIKQADVLQGLYFFEDEFDLETIKRNFDFYEPMTVHESSLSPCVHAILACKIGNYDKAYQMYLRTARLDLDDYNNDAKDGLHITSMAGSWMSVVKGFGGMKMEENLLSFRPIIPSQWQAYGFSVTYRGAILKLWIDQDQCTIDNTSNQDVTILINGDVCALAAKQSMQASTQTNLVI